jgi:hypothetical protein
MAIAEVRTIAAVSIWISGDCQVGVLLDASTGTRMKNGSFDTISYLSKYYLNKK